MTVPDEVDIIVVGGGSCGCVVAGRLANLDHNLQVMLIEAGESNLNVRLTGMTRSRPMANVLAEPLGVPSWYLPQEHEARQQDSFLLLLQALGMARWPTCRCPLCPHPWWWLQYQLYDVHSCISLGLR